MTTDRNHRLSQNLPRLGGYGILTGSTGIGHPDIVHNGRKGGQALLDVPNLRCAIYDCLDRHPLGDERLDAKRLLKTLNDGCGIKKAVAAYRYRDSPHSSKTGYHDYLQRSHWNVHALTRPRFENDNDPVDDWIQEMIYRQGQPENVHRLALISHDGGFAQPLRQFLKNEDAYVWIVGFLERLSGKLVGLTKQCDRVRLVDIEYHAGALRLPAGIRKLTAEMIAPTTSDDKSISVVEKRGEQRQHVLTQQAV